jgi:hypothetical protein
MKQKVDVWTTSTSAFVYCLHNLLQFTPSGVYATINGRDFFGQVNASARPTLILERTPTALPLYDDVAPAATELTHQFSTTKIVELRRVTFRKKHDPQVLQKSERSADETNLSTLEIARAVSC